MLPCKVQLVAPGCLHLRWHPAKMGPVREPSSTVILLFMCAVLLNYTSYFTWAKSVKIHKWLSATGGRLYHVILEVSAAWKYSIYVLARCMPAVQKLWQAAIQGTVDTLVCCDYVIMCLYLFGSSTWGEGPAVCCVLYNRILVCTSSLFFGFFGTF